MKTHLILVLALIFLTKLLTAQENRASLLLAAAIYEEEVTGNLVKAIDQYLDILKKYPDDRPVAAKTLYHLGLVHEKMGRQKADEYFRRLVSTYPDQTEMVALAKAKLALFRNATSESALQAGLSFKLAADLLKGLKYDSAKAEFGKVISLAPKSQQAQEAQLWIGQCYFKEGKYGLALNSYNTIIKEFPESSIVPITELMITQVLQALAEKPKKSTAVIIDDKTILDPVTGIRFTRINSWAGKNDVIKSASSITDIFPNRKFLLYDNSILPFDHTDSFTLFDTLTTVRNSRLSPDGKQVAFFNINGISVIPISPETGRPTEPAQKLLNKEFLYGNDINWSPDGKKLILSLVGLDNKYGLWSFSIIDKSLELVKKTSMSLSDPYFLKNGPNILYYRMSGGSAYGVEMKSTSIGKSMSILDSCAHGQKKFILSPDNQWILYDKLGDKTFLFRLADRQKVELKTPVEVGQFVSWADEGKKIFFYFPSSEKKNTIKVASIYGGSVYELGTQNNEVAMYWTPDGEALINYIVGDDHKISLKRVNLSNQDTKTIKDVGDFAEFPILSPDGTKLMGPITTYGVKDLSVLPFSYKEFKITGNPVQVFKMFIGTSQYDYSWSPDGTKILACQGGEVWICDVNGGTPRQLTKTPEIENNPLWSPDGKAIAVIIFKTKQLQIISSSDGKVLNAFEQVDKYAWMPEGKEIAIAFLGGEINIVSILTGKSRTIVNRNEIANSAAVLDLRISPDGKWISMIGIKNSNSSMFLINITDGKITELPGNGENNKLNVNWSPDSKWVSYSSFGKQKIRLESVLWEADMTSIMNTMKPGREKGFTADFDFKTLAIPEGGVPPDGTFTDTRDSHVYKYKKIGDQTWMAENLAYLPEVSPDSVTSSIKNHYYVYGFTGSDVKTAKQSENYQKFGVLYNWPATMDGANMSNSAPSGIQGACPSGWHVPSDAEWIELERTLGMDESDLFQAVAITRPSGAVDKKLKSQNGWDDDNIFVGQSGFNALPAGSIGPRFKSNRLYVYTYFQSTTLLENRPIIRDIYTNLYFRTPAFDKDWAFSVRCVKDKR